MTAVNPGENHAWQAAHARRYLEARYGKSVWFRAPETFSNVLERWIWFTAADNQELAGECISQIEEHFKEERLPTMWTLMDDAGGSTLFTGTEDEARARYFAVDRETPGRLLYLESPSGDQYAWNANRSPAGWDKI